MNILITSHSTLCIGLVNAYEMLVPTDATKIYAVPFIDEGISEFRGHLNETFAKLAEDGKVLILADLLGGSPYNEANLIYQQHQDSVRLLAGVNFPMLVEVGQYVQDGDNLDEAARIGLEAGRAGVIQAEPLVDVDNDSDEELF